MAVTLSGGTPTFTSGYAGGVITSGTAQASTSGTSIDFTGIPSWVKRITISYSGVSTNGSSAFIVQLGSGSITTTGYISYYSYTLAGSSGTGSATSGIGVHHGGDADVHYVIIVLTLLGSNKWVSSHSGGFTNTSTNFTQSGGGGVTLGGTLDRVRCTTTNGTDTFDAGTINILYE